MPQQRGRPGLAREDLSDAELDVDDELFPVVLGIRGIKA